MDEVQYNLFHTQAIFGETPLQTIKKKSVDLSVF